MEENLNNVTWKIILVFRAGTGEARVNQNSARRHGKAMQHTLSTD